MMRKLTMDEMTAYCDKYGFIFQGSKIYGGLANTWDYGPLGARLKNSIKDAWRRFFIQMRENSYELDSNILMNPKVWEASGHVQSFADPLLDCRECKTRHRADNLISSWDPAVNADAMTWDEMEALIREKNVPCPKCGHTNFTGIRQFNLMFATQRGVTRESGELIYLRPENAQGEYVNFLNVMRSMRTPLPFAIGQIGKAFRNEITPGNFTFRTVEFEQMEYQTFCKPEDAEALYYAFKDYGLAFFQSLGLPLESLRFHDHEKLAHYARAACDIEYRFPFGWGEINGTHNRTDFDLKRHQEYTGKAMTYFDSAANEKYIPYVVESTHGLDRIFLALLFEGLCEEELEGGETRLVLKIQPLLAPIKVNVLPLNKKQHGARAKEIYEHLRKYFMVSYEEAGNIGKRYRRGDAVGTPFAVTVDDTTLSQNTVTLRDRDTMAQTVVKAEDLVSVVNGLIEERDGLLHR